MDVTVPLGSEVVIKGGPRVTGPARMRVVVPALPPPPLSGTGEGGAADDNRVTVFTAGLDRVLSTDRLTVNDETLAQLAESVGGQVVVHRAWMTPVVNESNPVNIQTVFESSKQRGVILETLYKQSEHRDDCTVDDLLESLTSASGPTTPSPRRLP